VVIYSESEIPKAQRGIFARVKTSRADAMRAMCLQCVNYERQMVRDCPDIGCPLHHWRPYQERNETYDLE